MVIKVNHKPAFVAVPRGSLTSSRSALKYDKREPDTFGEGPRLLLCERSASMVPVRLPPHIGFNQLLTLISTVQGTYANCPSMSDEQ